MENSEFKLKAIGWIKADFKQKFATPRQGSLAKSSRASIELSPEWKGRGLLSGLESFSHVWIVSYLHLSNFKNLSAKIHPPRLRGAKVGVMGSRSPHRPNNLGLTLARILSCEGDDLQLAEVDLIEGTPVLDLKPYIGFADRPEEYSNGWLDKADSFDRKCQFSESAEAQLIVLSEQNLISEPHRIRALIVEMLSLDPRPPAYLDRSNPQFAVWVAGLNVFFEYIDSGFVITKIELDNSRPRP